jgi:hypothetical protein
MKEQRSLKHPLKPHALRPLSLEQLMGLRRPPAKQPLYQYQGKKGDIEVMNRGLTVVLSREINANVQMGADIAVSIAQKNPDRPVWYVNTIAGVELMQHVMEDARRNAALPEITPNPLLDLSEKTGDSAEVVEAVLPNLHYFEIPAGQWDAEALSAALSGRTLEREEEEHEYGLAYGVKAEPKKEVKEEDLPKPPQPIVIINSFDYSPLNRGGKWRMARELLELMDAFDLSLVLFTQEMRLEFVAGFAGRGSVGLLCGRADRVARMRDEFEHLMRSRIPRNSEDKGTVHEAQMLASKPRRRSILIKNEHGDAEFEISGSDARELARRIGEVLLE